MKTIIFISFLCIPFSFSHAQGKTRQRGEVSPLSWDVGASIGSYGGISYSELDFGLNFRFANYMNWRNVLFSRNGNSDISATGLDSSLRFEYFDQSSDRSISYKLFAGPGLRISNEANTGVFGEGGAILRLGGLSVGAGVKVLNYSNPGKSSTTGANIFKL